VDLEAKAAVLWPIEDIEEDRLVVAELKFP
jgi:hypothetical protein